MSSRPATPPDTGHPALLADEVHLSRSQIVCALDAMVIQRLQSPGGSLNSKAAPPGTAQFELPRTSRTVTVRLPHGELAGQMLPGCGRPGCSSPPSPLRNGRPARSRRPTEARSRVYALPDRYEAGARRVPGNRAGRRAGTIDARPTRRRASSQHRPPARPVRAVRGIPSGYTDRASGTKPVRYASVDTATQRPTATQGDTHRAKAETPRYRENSQPAGRFRRVWQVLGSNQRRLSRRFYRPLPLATRATCRMPPRLCGTEKDSP